MDDEHLTGNERTNADANVVVIKVSLHTLEGLGDLAEADPPQPSDLFGPESCEGIDINILTMFLRLIQMT